MRNLAALLVSTAFALPALANDTDTPIELTFVTHIEAGVAEQDVFVERLGTSSSVFRPGPGDMDPNAPLFAAAEPTAHDPANLDAIGPYPRGIPLDLTLGEWLGATGTGEYVVENGQGHLTIEFQGLVPNGVYTLWHFFMVNGETDPFIGSFDLPAGALDGSQSVFVADANGAATFDQTFATPLQLSGEQLMAGLAVNYHSDGQTYGVLPGDFGQIAHIQLFVPLPERPGL